MPLGSWPSGILVSMHDFRRLEVWRQARELAVEVHMLCTRFPRADRGVVASQLRRSALSIAANIAEGCGKSSRRETLRFLEIAAGSAAETEHHLVVAADLGFINKRASAQLAGRALSIQRMLRSLKERLPGEENSPRPH